MDRKAELDAEANARGLRQEVLPPLPGASHKSETEIVALIKDLVRGFVFQPNRVSITTMAADESESDVTILTLEVDPDDYGAVCGKAARKIQALRVITQLCGKKDGIDYRLIMPERERPRYAMQARFTPNLSWKPEATLNLLRRVLDRVLEKPYDIKVVSALDQTHLEVRADPKEIEWLMKIQPFLHLIFHAIGKNSGRELYIDATEAIIR